MYKNISYPIFIDSAKRSSGDINDSNYVINGLPNNDNEYSLLLKEFIISNDFYNINQFNNSFILGVTSIDTITIPENQYNATQYINYINNNVGSLGITGFSASFDSQAVKITYTNQTGSTIYLKKTNDKQKYLGLITDNVYSINNNDTLITDYKVDFSGTKKIVIESSIPVETFNLDNTSKNRLDEIYITEDFENEITYKNEYSIETNTSNISDLNIRLYDENHDPLQTDSNYFLKLLFFND